MSDTEAKIEAQVARLRDLRAGPFAFFDVVSLGSRAVASLELLLRGRSESIHQPRCLVADALSAIGGTEAIGALRRALADSICRDLDPVLRASEGLVIGCIAEHLGRTGRPEIAEDLLAALKVGCFPGCILALGRMRETRAAPLLVRCLYDDVARESAAESLRALGSVAVAELTRTVLEPHLVYGFEGASWKAGRAAAAILLGEIGGPAARAPLLNALSDRSGEVRFAAALALCAQGQEAGASVVPVLVHTLGAEAWTDTEAAKDALLALGEAAWPSIRAIIERRGADEPSERQRRRAIELASRMGQMNPVRTLDLVAADPSSKVRAAAVSALAMLPGDSSTRTLEHFLRDAEPGIRKLAVAALASRGPSILTAFASLLGDSAREVRQEVAGALRQAGPAALPALATALRARPAGVLRYIRASSRALLLWLRLGRGRLADGNSGRTQSPGRGTS